MAPENLIMHGLRNTFKNSKIMLRICPKLINGLIVIVLAISRMISAKLSKGRHFPNIDEHPSLNVTQAKRVIGSKKYIEWI